MTARAMFRALPNTAHEEAVCVLEHARDLVERLYFDDVDAFEQATLVATVSDIQSALIRLCAFHRGRT